MMNSKKLPSGNLNSNEIKARINQSFEGLYEIVSDKKMQEFITNLYNDYNGSPGLTFARDLLVLNYHNQIADDNWKASDTIKLKDFIQSEVERKVIHCQSTFNFIVENIKNTNLIHTSEAHYERCLTKLRTLSNTLTVVSYKAIVEELIISQLSIRRPLNQKKLDNFTEQELVTS
ncbi:MAG: hypothetical protein RLZZ605_45, partial [Bacteroidota bacterium]